MSLKYGSCEIILEGEPDNIQALAESVRNSDAVEADAEVYASGTILRVFFAAPDDRIEDLISLIFERDSLRGEKDEADPDWEQRQ